MCGAVAAGRLTVVTPFLEMVTTTGTSPAPANGAGSVKFMVSKPGICRFGWTERMAPPVIAVVPTVTVTAAGIAPRTPVTLNPINVGTGAPLASDKAAPNGSQPCKRGRGL